MFHATLFALLSGLLMLFALSAARADQIVVAVAALLMALWLGGNALRAGRGVHRRRQANRTGTDVDGRQ